MNLFVLKLTQRKLQDFVVNFVYYKYLPNTKYTVQLTLDSGISK